MKPEIFVYAERLEGRTGHEAGREILEKLYAQLVEAPLPPIVTAANGKPDFESGPWHFSISHTKTHAFCALARRPVGIDAEDLDRSIPEKLARRVLSPAEYAQYAAAEDKNEAFLHFWVLKEAAAKCTGKGIQYPENRTAFSLDSPQVWTYDGCIVAARTEEDYVI